MIDQHEGPASPAGITPMPPRSIVPEAPTTAQAPPASRTPSTKAVLLIVSLVCAASIPLVMYYYWSVWLATPRPAALLAAHAVVVTPIHHATPEAPWVELSRPDEGFTLLMPTPPKSETRKTFFLSGNTAVTTYTATLDNSVFSIFSFRLLKQPRTRREINICLASFNRNMRTHYLHGAPGEIIDLNLLNHPGTELTGPYSASHTSRIRLYIVKNRLYALTAIYPGHNASIADTFLNSLTLQ